mmetsp:Transcript_21153/g.53581  ORF Transcript_21153/g.53581 Transcript_21153/m.53581 type:complete len:267 (-) Transcript_21153:375-1175(-)
MKDAIARSPTVGAHLSRTASSSSLSTKTAPICLLRSECCTCAIRRSSLSPVHATRKASPMFLLAKPPQSCTAWCTMWPTELVKSITCSCRHSVASVNWRMSQKPKRQFTLMPTAIGLMSPVVRRQRAIVSLPASPMPTCSSEAILRMDCSSSYSSSNESFSKLPSLAIGSLAKELTSAKSFSMGAMQYLLAIRLKTITPPTSSTKTKASSPSEYSDWIIRSRRLKKAPTEHSATLRQRAPACATAYSSARTLGGCSSGSEKRTVPS